MGNTIKVGDIPAQFTVEKIKDKDSNLINQNKIDVQLGGGILEVKNVPDCWVVTICKEISEIIDKVLNWEDKTIVLKDGVIRSGDYIGVSTSGGAAWGTISWILDGFVYFDCEGMGPSIEVPISAIKPVDNRTNLSWNVKIADWGWKDAEGHSVILKDGDKIKVSTKKEEFEAEVLLDTKTNEIFAIWIGNQMIFKPENLLWDRGTNQYTVYLNELNEPDKTKYPQKGSVDSEEIEI